jgi:hypothetical protein
MAKGPISVDTFFSQLDHPLAGAMQSLRAAILAADPAISEHIKWNAPSFRHAGDDRVTYRLPPKGGFQLIFHRGAKVKDSQSFAFHDFTGLIDWAARDRGVVTFADADAMRARQGDVVALVKAWMQATQDRNEDE